ncbi:hypothetical protein L1987_02758 [Smallanthus sonchifolius]|uniref:Uncharacterized protein n=1 Tax=Smallanthus sonchifolius TaxID=185202 RepID=A0ACB9K8Y1_9ASTR|nr:hypothetical protein L1987_02758 [Smallanthus sonchifolius]
MTEVVGSLDRALSFQGRNASSTQGGVTIKKAWSLFSPKRDFEIRSSGRMGSNDQLPAIKSLQIDGDAFPGACPSSRSGHSCYPRDNLILRGGR